MESLLGPICTVINQAIEKKKSVVIHKAPEKLKFFLVALRHYGLIHGFISLPGHYVVCLKYGFNGVPYIRKLSIVSTPSKLVYISGAQLIVAATNRGTALIETPRGIISARDAIKLNAGGKLLCYVF